MRVPLITLALSTQNWAPPRPNLVPLKLHRTPLKLNWAPLRLDWAPKTGLGPSKAKLGPTEKPVAQWQSMVSGPLPLPYSLLDGSCYVSRAAAPEGGRSPVEYRGNLSIRTYVRPSERASIVTGKPELDSRRPELASRMP